MIGFGNGDPARLANVAIGDVRTVAEPDLRDRIARNFCSDRYDVALRIRQWRNGQHGSCGLWS